MITLGIEVDNRKKCPFWFSKTDSKILCNYVLFEYLWDVGNYPNVIGMLEKSLHLDLAPLRKVAVPEMPLEEKLADAGNNEEKRKKAIKDWKKEKASNEAAWQPPQKLTECIQKFLNALDNNPNIFKKLKVTDSYFTEGVFKQDLTDLLHMAKWAKENAKKMRLNAG